MKCFILLFDSGNKYESCVYISVVFTYIDWKFCNWKLIWREIILHVMQAC